MTAILDHSRLYHFQELDYHPHRACSSTFTSCLSPERRAQAYGEVLWFGGRVTALTLVSFIFMVTNRRFDEIPPGTQTPLQVVSSVIAAWSDASQISPSVAGGLSSMTTVVTSLNVGYLWMLSNCLVSAAYVRRFNKQKKHGVDMILRQVLAMRKKIKATGFSDWDSMFYNNLLSIPVLILFSFIVEDWSSDNLEQSLYVMFVPLRPNYAFLLTGPSLPMQPERDTWPAALCNRVLGRCRSGDFIYYSMVHPRDQQYDLQVRNLMVNWGMWR
jgi:hypothetical protein